MFGILRNFVRFFTKVTDLEIYYILKDENWI